MIRSKLHLLILIVSCAGAFLSCNDDKEWRSDIHELKFETSEEQAILGEKLTFTDLSLGVAQRTWTFEDGIPAVSNDPVVYVEFTKAGAKQCTLELLYDNGTTERKEFTVQVAEPLKGDIQVANLSALNTVSRNTNVQFSVETQGEPTSYSWVFPGGSPATSTDAAPTVTWNKRGFVTVQLEISRSSDNATVTLEKEIYVGNYPLLVPYTAADMDSWSFDAGSKIGKWTAWSGAAGADMIPQGKASIVSGGADGTDKCMQINYNKVGVAWQLFTRDNWTNNAHLEKGKKYEFIFWMKADANFSLSEVILINNLPDWSWNELLEAHSKNNWSQYFPDIPFAVQNETRLVYAANVPITTIWQQFRYEFTVGNTDIQGITLPDLLLNTYPFFVVNSSTPEKIYIDEVQINLLED